MTLIGRVPNLAMELEGMNNYTDFNVIKIVDGVSLYPALLGIGWDNDSLEVIKLKKRAMTFENRNIKVIAPMDQNEGRRYVEPIKEEVVGGWDLAYNISKAYLHPTANREMG